MNLKKFGKQALSVVSQMAPAVATAIGGPFGGLAAAALQAAFGTDDEAEINRALATASPDTLAKLKAAEMEMRAEMKRLDISEEQLYLEDTQSARSMATSRGIIPQISLTLIAMIIYGVLLATLFTSNGESDLSDWQQGQLGILIGVLTTALMQSWNFFFGTSKGSKDKGDQIAAMNR